MSVDITSLSVKVESVGIKEASSQLGGLSTSAANAEKKVLALTEAMKKLNAISVTINATTGSTAALAAALTALNTTIGALAQRTHQADTAQRVHNESMREAHGLARGLAGSMGALWLTYGSATGIAAGLAIGSALKGVLEVGKEVEKQLNFVFALSDSRQVVDLDSFIKITESSVQSITDAANAMRALAQNGLSVGESLSALPSILNLATVGEMSVGQAAIAATGAVSAFGLNIAEVERVTDIFAKTAATSNTSVLAMTESMKQASTSASLFKVSIEETAAMLGLLAKINITGGAAGTSLTNMLTGLYEPTDQAKKAMQRLGVTAFEQNGKLKNMTVLLEDIKRASSSLSEEAKADIFGDMVTARGMKSLVLALDNLDTLKSKTKDNAEAMGFMKGVVEKLEDSSSAAFKRMSVIIESEFTQAFATAAPEVQALGIALGDLFKSDAPMRMNSITGKMEQETTAIANLIKNLAIAANFLVDHIGTIGSVVAAYVVWRAAIGYTIVTQTALGTSTATVGGLYTAWRTAVLASSAAQALATTTMIAHTTAQAAGAGTTALATAAWEANTASVAANAAAQRAAMAFILPALGVLAVAVAAGAALWLLFRDNVSDAADANTKMTNSIHVIDEQLKREEERLERVIGLWDERKKAFNDSTSVAPTQVKAAQATLDAIQKQIDTKYGKNAAVEYFSQMNMDLATQYLAAKENVEKLNNMQQRSVNVGVNKSYEKTLNEISSFKEKVEAFRKEAEVVGSKGKDDFLVSNPKERALRLSAASIVSEIDKINTKEIAGPALEAAKKRVSELQVDFKKLNDAVSNTKKPNVTPTDRATVNDGMYKELEGVQERIELAKRTLRQTKEATDSQVKQGILGELGAINKIEEAEKSYNNTLIAVANDKIAVLRKNKNQEAAIRQELTNIRVAEQNKAYASDDAANKRLEYSAKLVQDSQKDEAEMYLKKRQFVKAFEADEARRYDLEIKRLNQSLSAATDATDKIMLVKRLAAIQAAKDSGITVAANKEAEDSFNNLADASRNSMRGIKTENEGQGLAAMWEAAQAASAKYKAELPALQEAMAKITDTKGQNDAAAKMDNLAETQRKMWVGVGESISKSLESAFGKGGKAAAELFKITQNYSNLENKTGSARVKAYGDAAGAAKNFFKEGSSGYKLLENAEKAFRALELAGMLQSLIMTGTVEAGKQAFKIPTVLMEFMSSMGPLGLAAGAAAIAAIGVSGGGGGGGSSSVERQKKQGTGSVLGSDEKSNSIMNSLSIMEKNSGLGLAQGNQMVNHLKVVADNISALAGLIVRTTGITGDTAPDKARFESSGILSALGGKYITKVLNSIFGGSTSVQDTGFSLKRTTVGAASAGGVIANQYTDVKKDGGWFRSDKYSTDMKSLGADANAQFSKTISGMADAIKEAAKGLGMGGDAFNAKLASFVVDLGKVSLKGMTGDQVQQALQGVFSKLGDDMAKFAIVGLDRFQQVGEGYLETVVRVANNLMQVRDVFAILGKTFDMTGLAAINVSEGLIAAAGGIEKLTNGTKFFVDNFLTEAEKMGPITASVTKRLNELGVSELTSIELFKKKIRGLDLTNAADQKLYANLLELAPAFKEAADYADGLANGVTKLSNAQQKALDAVNKAKDNLQKAYDKESSALQSTIDKTKAFITTLKNYQDSIKLGADSPLTNMQKYAEAKKQLDATLLAAKGGDQGAKDKLTGAATALLSASRIINASGDAYTSDFNMVQRMLDDMIGSAGAQVDVAQASLDALNKQVEGLMKVNDSVLSVTQAVQELKNAIILGGLAGLTNTQMETTYTPTQAEITAVAPATTITNPANIARLYESLDKMGASIDSLRAEQAEQTGALAGVTIKAAEMNAEATVEGLEGTFSKNPKQRAVNLV